MNRKIGFIGCGNMGKAMVGALISSNQISMDQLMISVRSEESKAAIMEKWPIKTTLDNKEVAARHSAAIDMEGSTDGRKTNDK